jgi:WD40 repeat protein
LPLTNFAFKAWLGANRERVLSVSGVKTVKGHAFQIDLWDATSSKLLSSVAVPREESDWVTPNLNCSQLLLFGGDRVQLLEANTGNQLFREVKFPSGIATAKFSPDSRQVLILSENAAHVLDAATGKPLFPPLRHQCPVYDAEFSRDGRYIATCGLDDSLTPREAQVWDALTGKRVGLPLKHGDGVFRAVFSPNGQAVVTASEDGTARIWEVATGKPLTPPLRHSVAVYDANFSPDGRWICTASQDKTARVWDATTGEPLTPRLNHDGLVQQAVFLADGGFLLTVSASAMTIWELPSNPWPADDLMMLAGAMSGHRIDATGALEPLNNDTMSAGWTQLRLKHPAFFEYSGHSKKSSSPVPPD